MIKVEHLKRRAACLGGGNSIYASRLPSCLKTNSSPLYPSTFFNSPFPLHPPIDLFCNIFFDQPRFPFQITIMGKGKDAPSATPARTPTLKKQPSSTGQRTINSFFTKSSPAIGTPTPTQSNAGLKVNGTGSSANAMAKPKSTSALKKPAFKKPTIKSATPVPSSDAMGPPSSQENENGEIPEDVCLYLLASATSTKTYRTMKGRRQTSLPHILLAVRRERYAEPTSFLPNSI